MKSIKVFVVVGALALASSGCASWIAAFRADPIVAIHDNVGYVRTAVSLARSAFEVWASLNGGDVSDTRRRFEHIASEVDTGLLLAQDGLAIAATARNEGISSATLLSQARDALGRLQEFLVGLSGPRPGAAADPLMREAIDALQRARTRR